MDGRDIFELWYWDGVIQIVLIDNWATFGTKIWQPRLNIYKEK